MSVPQSMSRMFLISTSDVQRVPDSTPNVQSVKILIAHVQTLPSYTVNVESVSFYSPYPDSTEYLKPISSQYSILANSSMMGGWISFILGNIIRYHASLMHRKKNLGMCHI